jgi:hypothetical protein
MATVTARFFESGPVLLALLEWTAIQKLAFHGDAGQMATHFAEHQKAQAGWVKMFNRDATQHHRDIYADIITGKIASLPAFYARIDRLAASRPAPGKSKTSAKKPAITEDKFEHINNPALLDDIKQLAFELAGRNASPETATDTVVELMVKHNFLNPTDSQIKVLFEYLEGQMANHLLADRVEAAIIDTDDKNLIFMWNKIKRKFPRYDNFVWPSSLAAKEGKCSKSEVRPIMQMLEKLGAIRRMKTAPDGQYSARAAVYRREI